MALERVPSDIRAQGGVARMSPVSKIREIQKAVSIPVMAKCRIGHFVEAQILEALEVDFIDESEVLTPADEAYHIDKHAFRVPFVCGCRDLGEALRRIGEGAAMIRTKGEAGTGNIVEAVRHMRAVVSTMKRLTTLTADELMAEANALGCNGTAQQFSEFCLIHRRSRYNHRRGKERGGAVLDDEMSEPEYPFGFGS
jgi:pyridoxal 5'-phosphate synthase pdxS subunit